MKALRPLAVIVFLALPLLAGEVVGHAVITKRLTKKALAPIVYNLRGTALPAAPTPEAVNEFDRMVVMLEGSSLPSKAPITASIEQRNGRFDPEIVIVPIGSTIDFPNFDPIFHNVFSLSKTQPFDLGFYPKGQSRSVKFNRSGIVQVYCHIHANMYAAIVVTSSPWFGRPASDGSFLWSDVPAGHYRLIAWHKIAGLYKTEFDVPESGKADVSIQVPVDVEPHP